MTKKKINEKTIFDIIKSKIREEVQKKKVLQSY